MAVPADLEPIFEAKLTEVMSRGFPGRGQAGEPAARRFSRRRSVPPRWSWDPDSGAKDSLALARGIAARIEAPLVIDADGLNAYAGRLEALRGAQAPTVLTPHAGELGRLLERDSDEVGAHVSRARARRPSAAARPSCSRATTRSSPIGERLAVNAGGPGARHGRQRRRALGGDCRALARGMEPFAAACAGVLAHARAGRLAAEHLGAAESVIATDVIAALPGRARG